MKRCARCKATQPTSDFNKLSRASDGLDHQCRQCRAISRREQSNKDKRTAKRFGITVEQLNELKRDTCAICERIPSTPLNLDHDHACCPGVPSCGKCVRSYICWDCNIALGRVRDDINILLRMVKYLEGA